MERTSSTRSTGHQAANAPEIAISTRVGERAALVHALARLRERALQALGIDLVDQRREAIDERKPGRHEGRELPRHDGELLRADALEEPGDGPRGALRRLALGLHERG